MNISLPTSKKPSIFIGIDLGTTNSYVVVSETTISGECHSEVLSIQQETNYGGNIISQQNLPSVVLLPADPNHFPSVGQKAFESHHLTEELGRIDYVKNYIGQSKKIWRLAGETWSPVEVASEILKVLLQVVRDERFIDEIDEAMISVPSSFTQPMMEATIAAGKMAGLQKVHLIHEPVAAILEIVQKLESTGAKNTLVQQGLLNGFDGNVRVLVFDIGGGTTDVTIIDLQECHINNEYRLRPCQRSMSPHTLLAGGSFDKALAQMFIQRYQKEMNLRLDPLINEQLLRSFMPRAEEAKKTLCNNYKRFIQTQQREPTKDDWAHIKAPLRLSIPGQDSFSIVLTYNDLVETFKPLLGWEVDLGKPIDCVGMELVNPTSVVQPIAIALQQAQCTASDIDIVIPIGGMSHLPMISERLEAIFGSEKCQIMRVAPDVCVAQGAAIHHRSISLGTSLLETLLPPTKVLLNINGHARWDDLIPEHTVLIHGRTHMASKGVVFPCGQKEVYLPIQRHGEVKGAILLKWPSEISQDIPVTLEISASADASSILRGVMISERETVSFVIDDEYLIALPDEPQNHVESSRVLRTAVMNKLNPATRSPMCDDISKLPDQWERALNLLEKLSKSENSRLIQDYTLSVITAFKDIGNILKASCSTHGIPEFITPSERNTLMTCTSQWVRVKSIICTSPIFVKGYGKPGQVLGQILHTLGLMRSMLPNEGEAFFMEKTKVIQGHASTEAYRGLGRCGRSANTFIWVASQLKHQPAVGAHDAIYWALARMVYNPNITLKEEHGEPLKALFLKALKDLEQHSNVSVQYSALQLLIALKAMDSAKNIPLTWLVSNHVAQRLEKVNLLNLKSSVLHAAIALMNEKGVSNDQLDSLLQCLLRGD